MRQEGELGCAPRPPAAGERGGEERGGRGGAQPERTRGGKERGGKERGWQGRAHRAAPPPAFTPASTHRRPRPQRGAGRGPRPPRPARRPPRPPPPPPPPPPWPRSGGYPVAPRAPRGAPGGPSARRGGRTPAGVRAQGPGSGFGGGSGPTRAMARRSPKRRQLAGEEAGPLLRRGSAASEQHEPWNPKPEWPSRSPSPALFPVHTEPSRSRLYIYTPLQLLSTVRVHLRRAEQVERPARLPHQARLEGRQAGPQRGAPEGKGQGPRYGFVRGS